MATIWCAKTYPWCFLLLLVYLGTVDYVSVEISLGSFWRRDILRVKGQALFTNCNFLWLCVICNHWVATIWSAIKYPRCLYFFGLSKCCCLQFCRNKFGLLLVQGYFKGQRSRIYHKLQLFMTLCDMQSSSGNYSSTHGVFTSFNLSKCCYLHFWRKKFGSMLAQGYFNGSKVKHKSKIVTFCELAQSNEFIEWPLSDAPTSILVFFFFFFFYFFYFIWLLLLAY